MWPTLRRAGYTTAIFGKIHNNQAGWLCSPDNHSEPFDHVETAAEVAKRVHRQRSTTDVFAFGAEVWALYELHGEAYTQRAERLAPWAKLRERIM